MDWGEFCYLFPVDFWIIFFNEEFHIIVNEEFQLNMTGTLQLETAKKCCHCPYTLQLFFTTATILSAVLFVVCKELYKQIWNFVPSGIKMRTYNHHWKKVECSMPFISHVLCFYCLIALSQSMWYPFWGTVNVRLLLKTEEQIKCAVASNQHLVSKHLSHLYVR